MREEGTILVTGGAGFIGSHLCERLIERGSEVACLDNFSPGYDPALKEANVAGLARSPRFHLVRGDVRELDLVRALLEKHHVTQVVHLAARAGVRASLEDPIGYEQVNVRGTLVLLEAVRRHPVRTFVFGSSSSVYGVSSAVSFRESDRLGTPYSPYAASKRTAEHFCHVYSQLFRIPLICLRFFTVFGPRNRPDMAAYRFVTAILRGEPVPVYGDGSARRDFTFVADTVSGIEAALAWEGSFDVVNLGNGRPVPLNAFLSLLEIKTGKQAKVVNLPEQPGDVAATCADTSRAEQVLGFRARVPLEEGVDRLVAWAREFADGSAGPRGG